MSTSTTNRRFDLTPLIVDGHRKYADDGAVRQQGPKPAFRCSCGAVVVWLKSARTGRSYLASCGRYTNADERYYYVGGSPHTWERHDAKVADNEREVARLERQQPAVLRAEYIDGLREMVDIQNARPWNAAEATATVNAVLIGLNLADRMWPV